MFKRDDFINLLTVVEKPMNKKYIERGTMLLCSVRAFLFILSLCK